MRPAATSWSLKHPATMELPGELQGEAMSRQDVPPTLTRSPLSAQDCSIVQGRQTLMATSTQMTQL
jgi:hypothetical protein